MQHPWFGLIKEIKIRSTVEAEQKIAPAILSKLLAYKNVHLFKKGVLNILVKMLKPKEITQLDVAFK